MAAVFIVSGEWNLRGAVRAELREAGITAMGMENLDDMARTIARGSAPDAVVVDGEILRGEESREKLQNLATRVPVLVVGSRVDPPPAVSGAEVMLKPVRVKQIASRVLNLLGKRPRRDSPA